VSTQEQPWRQVEAWMGSPSLRMLSETGDFASVLAELVRRSRVCGPAVHDAPSPRFAWPTGVEVRLTRDRDFSFFPELSTENPFG
jgi:hypothetical protein